MQWGDGISLKRNSKKLSKKTYDYFKSNKKLKDFDWYVFQKDRLLLHLINDKLTKKDWLELKDVLNKNDKINHISIYDNIKYFKDLEKI